MLHGNGKVPAGGQFLSFARSSGAQGSPNRRNAAAVFASKVSHALAVGMALSDLAGRASVQHGLATELLAHGLGPLNALFAALTNELALEFVHPAHDCE